MARALAHPHGVGRRRSASAPSDGSHGWPSRWWRLRWSSGSRATWRAAPRTERRVDLGAAIGWSLALALLLGPVLLPWYVMWALPFVWLLPKAPRVAVLGAGVGPGPGPVGHRAAALPRTLRDRVDLRALDRRAHDDRLADVDARRPAAPAPSPASPGGSGEGSRARRHVTDTSAGPHRPSAARRAAPAPSPRGGAATPKAGRHRRDVTSSAIAQRAHPRPMAHRNNNASSVAPAMAKAFEGATSPGSGASARGPCHRGRKRRRPRHEVRVLRSGGVPSNRD